MKFSKSTWTPKRHQNQILSYMDFCLAKPHIKIIGSNCSETTRFEMHLRGHVPPSPSQTWSLLLSPSETRFLLLSPLPHHCSGVPAKPISKGMLRHVLLNLWLSKDLQHCCIVNWETFRGGDRIYAESDINVVDAPKQNVVTAKRV